MPRTRDSVAMPFATLASLAPTVASGLASLAGRVADAMQSKATDKQAAPAKNQSKSSKSTEAASLANAFAACLASVSSIAPTVTFSATPAASAKSANAATLSAPTAALSLGLPKATPTLPATAKMPAASAPTTVTPSSKAAHPATASAQAKGIVPTAGTTMPKSSSLQVLNGESSTATLLQVQSLDLKTPSANASLLDHAPEEAGNSVVDPPAAATEGNTAAAAISTVALSSPQRAVAAVSAAEERVLAASNVASAQSTASSVLSPRNNVSVSRTGQYAALGPSLMPASHSETQASNTSPTPQGALLATPVSVAGNTRSSATPAPPVADQLTQAFLTQTDAGNPQGRTDFHLRLDPPQLGSVQIHLTASEQTVSARIVVAQEGTRQLIESQAHHLRQGLAEAGLTLGHFDVTRDGGGWSGGQQAPPELPQFAHAAPFAASPSRTAAVSTSTNRLTDGIDILA